MNESSGLEQLTSIARGMWRFRWLAIGTVWCILLLGWPITYLMGKPDYTAQAQIYIDTQSVLSPFLQGLTIPMNPSEQLGLMTRQLVTDPNLKRVIQKTGLDQKQANPVPLDILLENLRKNIHIRAERTSARSGYTNYYSISYTNRNPFLAEAVLQSLIDAFSENTLAQIREDAERAMAYIGEQIETRKAQIVQAETRLRDFRRRHAGMLSSGTEGYFGRLYAAEEQLSNVDLAIRETESRRITLQRQLAETPTRVRAVSPDGAPLPTSLEERLISLRRDLDQALLKYTSRHPTVMELESSLRLLEEELRKGPGPVPTMPNPIHEQLSIRMSDVEGELAELQTKREDYHRRVNELREQMETLPRIEDDLKRLMDEHSTLTENYQALIARRQSIETTKKVSGDNGTVEFTDDLNFRVIDPPNVPIDSVLESFRKTRVKLVTFVLLAGLGGGAALAYLLFQLRPPVYSQRLLGAITSVPVYGVISQVRTRSWHLRTWLDAAAFSVCCLMVLIAYVTTVYFQTQVDGMRFTRDTVYHQSIAGEDEWKS